MIQIKPIELLIVFQFLASFGQTAVIIRDRTGNIVPGATSITLAELTNRLSSIQVDDQLFFNWRGYSSMATNGARNADASRISVIAVEDTAEPGPGVRLISSEFSVVGIAQRQRTIFSYDVRALNAASPIKNMKLGLAEFQAVLAGQIDVTETIRDQNQNLLGTLAVHVTSFGVTPSAGVDRLSVAPQAGVSVTKDIVLSNGGPEDTGNASLGQIDQTIPHPVVANLSCVKLVRSADDLDGNAFDNHVLLPADGKGHPISYSISVTAGNVGMMNVKIDDPMLRAQHCKMPKPFSLAAGQTKTFALCSLMFNCGRTRNETCGNPSLGAASAVGVLELGGANVSITGPSGVNGDVEIAPRGQLAVSGSSFVTGTVSLAANALYRKSGSGFVGHIVSNADLSAMIRDALTGSASTAGRACTQSFETLGAGTINGRPGENVICARNIIINGGKALILNAPLSASFIINVSGKLALTGGSKIKLAGGLLAANVLFNVIGTGEAIAFSGGTGGPAGASSLDGTILAPQRTINLSPGYVFGSVVGGMNINLTSGAKVTCSASTSPRPAFVNTVTVTADSAVGMLTSQCSATVQCQE